jgi:hypothetical protein
MSQFASSSSAFYDCVAGRDTVAGNAVLMLGVRGLEQSFRAKEPGAGGRLAIYEHEFKLGTN